MQLPGAAHTPVLQPLADGLRQRLEGLTPQPAQVPFYSALKARRCRGDELGPDYWADSIHCPVRFADVIRQLLGEQFRHFVELGPKPNLTSAITQVGRAAEQPCWALPTFAQQQSGLRTLAQALGKLYCQGTPIAWQRLYQGDPTGITLPHYPWQRERCWISLQVPSTASSSGAAAVAVNDGSASGTAYTSGNGSTSGRGGAAGAHGRDTAASGHGAVAQPTTVPPRRAPAASGNPLPPEADVPCAAADLAPEPRHIAQLPEEEREQALTSYLCEQLGHTFNMSPATIGLREPLTQMGFDSLMALELKNRVESELRVKISVTSFMEGPTIAGLVTLLLPQLAATDALGEVDIWEMTSAVIQDMSAEEAEEFLTQLESMSDQEVEDYIKRRLEEKASTDQEGEQIEKGKQA